MKAWPVLGILFIESILLLAHWFIYSTVTVFFAGLGAAVVIALKWVLCPLAFSFIVAALLSYRFGNPLVRGLYKIAAIWLGFLNFFFFAACFTWAIWLALLLGVHHQLDPAMRPVIAAICFGLACAAGVYGLINACVIRVRRVPVTLPGLPSNWRGRTALLVSDLHLGHVNRVRFAGRIVALASRLKPDIVFLPGDVFDGSKVDADLLVAPLKQLHSPLGTFFATGNHDEFGDASRFLSALSNAGIRILNNEKVIVDGLQLVGVSYHDTTYPIRLRATLLRLQVDPSSASILLSHVPNRLPIVEEAGISLQLSGHTHGGQFVPFTWLTRRVFGKFTHGLHSFGKLQVYTSYGAGTWGPPMRVGTTPEVVLFQFE